MVTPYDLSATARAYLIKQTLNGMTCSNKRGFGGCIQGYWGHCFLLFMVYKRDMRSGKLFIGGESPDHNQRGVHASVKHWREEAEEDLRGRLSNLFIKMSPFPANGG